MSSLTLKQLAELRRLAENATPGPWDYYRPHPNYRAYEVGQVMPAGYLGEAVAATEDVYAEKNAAFIAAANPAAVLGLLDDNDALRAELAHMTEARNNARAEVERLTAIVNSDVFEATRGGVRIPRFDVPYPGGSTTADFMRTMAKRLPSKGVMGSNCSNTAASILAAYADALDALDGGQR